MHVTYSCPFPLCYSGYVSDWGLFVIFCTPSFVTHCSVPAYQCHFVLLRWIILRGSLISFNFQISEPKHGYKNIFYIYIKIFNDHDEITKFEYVNQMDENDKSNYNLRIHITYGDIIRCRCKT